MDIHVAFENYRPHGPFKRGQLDLIFSGSDFNDQLINGIGRILSKRIPMYAFPPELINIERIIPESGYIDSVPFNHDYMRLRLSQLPLIGVDPDIPMLHEQYWLNVNYLDKDRKRHPSEKSIEAYVDVKNDSSDLLHVTTNDMQVYISDANRHGNQSQIYNKDFPFLLISLRPNERFKCSMKAALGVGLRHSIWNSASNYWYSQIPDSEKTKFCFQSASAINEFVLMERALNYFKKMTQTYKDEIKRLYDLEPTHQKIFKILIKNEDHTFGEALNYEFQSHKDIKRSGNTKPDHLLREIAIVVEAYQEEKLLPALMEGCDTLIKKIETVEKQFIPLAKMHNNSLDKEPSQKQTKKKQTKS